MAPLKDELQPQETPSEGVRRVLLAWVDNIYDLMVEPVDERETAVHNARKSCKRIRALLRLVQDDIGHEVYQVENCFYRDTSRLLAPIRDSAVMVETLDHLTAAYAADLPTAPFATIREKLAARHTELSHDLLDKLHVMEQVAERMVDGRSRLLHLPLAGNEFPGQGLGRVYKTGRRAMKLAYATHDPHQLHDWRKQVKYLWHQLEFLQPTCPIILGELTQDLHLLSDFLGQAHDLVELKHILHDERERFGGEPDLPTLVMQIETAYPQQEDAAYTLGQRLYHNTPGALITRLGAHWNAWQLEHAMPSNKT